MPAAKAAIRFNIPRSTLKNRVHVGDAIKFGPSSDFNPLPDNKILDWSKLKQIADDIFKFDKNSRKFSERVENTVGKGDIAGYKQFLLFPQCFQKACFLEASKGVIVWKWVKLDQERLLCKYLSKMTDVGYGYSRQETLNLATDYAIHFHYVQKKIH